MAQEIPDHVRRTGVLAAVVQCDVPAQVMDRVMSLVTGIMSPGVPLGMLIAGPNVEAIGVDRWMVWAGAGMILLGAGRYIRTCCFERPLASPTLGGSQQRRRG